jgi:hypothetical protein
MIWGIEKCAFARLAADRADSPPLDVMVLAKSIARLATEVVTAMLLIC